jgi:hypothetical protein
MNDAVLVQQHASTKTELLQSTEFANWDELVRKSPHGTIFHNSWWLEATGWAFEILVCRDEDGQIVAGIPLPRKIRAGLTLFHSPILTPYLGPIFDLSRGECPREKLSLMRSLGESLARAIGGYDSLVYGIGASAPDLQGFLWAGFNVYLAYTFRLEVNGTLDRVLSGATSARRRDLNMAQTRQIVIQSDNGIDSLIELNRQTFARQRLPMPYSESQLRRLWVAAQSHGQGKIYIASDARGVPAAGKLAVHDTRCTYDLVSGMSGNDSGGGHLALWHAIRDALLAGRVFDFEGSSIRGIEQYIRRWGAQAKPVWRLERAGTVRGALARMLWRKALKG